MSFLSPILQTLPYLTAPTLFGWVIWVLLLGVSGYSLYAWRRYHLSWRKSQWGIFFGLLVLTPFVVLLVGFHLTSSAALPTPGIPTAQYGSALLPFAAIPWTLAAGLLGPVGAALIGSLTGLLRGLWDTHSLFTMLETALLAAIFSAAIRQRYRTLVFRVLRQPLFAVFLLIPLQMALYVLGSFLRSQEKQRSG
jgi:hypothetical protein